MTYFIVQAAAIVAGCAAHYQKRLAAWLGRWTAFREGTMVTLRITHVNAQVEPTRVEIHGETMSGYVERGMQLVVPIAPDADLATFIPIEAVRHVDLTDPQDHYVVLLAVPGTPVEEHEWLSMLIPGTIVHASHVALAV